MIPIITALPIIGIRITNFPLFLFLKSIKSLLSYGLAVTLGLNKCEIGSDIIDELRDSRVDINDFPLTVYKIFSSPNELHRRNESA